MNMDEALAAGDPARLAGIMRAHLGQKSEAVLENMALSRAAAEPAGKA
jgi:hypothetical protein